MVTRVGICGAGRISRFHANGFVRAGAEVVAVADPRTEAATQLAKEFDAASYDSLEEMLGNETLDVVAIATPHDVHVAQARAALDMGADVFMDKPLAMTPEQGTELIRRAHQVGRRLGVNHNLLFHPAVLHAKEVLASGEIGDVVSATSWSLGWLGLTPWDFRLDRARAGGGAWFDAGPHLLYTLADLVGPFERVSGFASTAASRLGGEDTAVAIGQFVGGAVATFRVSYTHSEPGSHLAWPTGWRQGFEINGTEGAVRLTVTPTGSLDVFTDASDAWTHKDFPEEFSVSFDGAIADFLLSRATGEPPRVPPESSLTILELTARALA